MKMPIALLLVLCQSVSAQVEYKHKPRQSFPGTNRSDILEANECRFDENNKYYCISTYTQDDGSKKTYTSWYDAKTDKFQMDTEGVPSEAATCLINCLAKVKAKVEQPKIVEPVKVKEPEPIKRDNFLDDSDYDFLWGQFKKWQVDAYYANMYSDGTTKHYDGWEHTELTKHHYGTYWNRLSPNARQEWYDYFWPKLDWGDIKSQCLARARQAEADAEYRRNNPPQYGDN